MGATRGTSTCMLANYERLVKTLDNIAGVDAEKVIKKCTADAKSRAQAWVSAAVCEVYAIKKAQRTQRAGLEAGYLLSSDKFII